MRAYYYEEGIKFCGKFEDGTDCRYEMPSKQEMLCDEISQVMLFNSLEFISPLYDYIDTDEEEEEEEE